MKKYFLAGILLVMAGLIAYHYIAANQAEQQISEAVRKQVEQSMGKLSVQYSEIDIAPFSGNISLRDVTVIENRTIRRSSLSLFDLSYWDFLNIYFRGLRFGMDRVTETRIILIQASQINRETLTELKFDTLRIDYKGNMWNGLSKLYADSSLSGNHRLSFNSSGFRFAKPGSGIGSFKSGRANADLHFSEKPTNTVLPNGKGTLSLINTTWTPPSTFQEKYSFFIKGFGFQPDSIPVQKADFTWQMEPPNIGLNLKGTMETELAAISLSGSAILEEELSNTGLRNFTITVTDFSEQFAGVLDNMEKLFNIRLPRKEEALTFQLGGTLSKPVYLNN